MTVRAALIGLSVAKTVSLALILNFRAANNPSALVRSNMNTTCWREGPNPSVRTADGSYSLSTKTALLHKSA